MKKSIGYFIFLLCLGLAPQLFARTPTGSYELASTPNWTSFWSPRGTITFYSKLLDASSLHLCRSDLVGGSCGRVTLTTGASGCQSWSVNWGVDLDIKFAQTAGVKFKTGGSRSWSVCNTRSESVSCEPNRGFSAQAQVNARFRAADLTFRPKSGMIGQLTMGPNDSCPVGYNKRSWRNGGGVLLPPRTVYACAGDTSARIKRSAFWFERRITECVYRRI